MGREMGIWMGTECGSKGEEHVAGSKKVMYIDHERKHYLI